MAIRVHPVRGRIFTTGLSVAHFDFRDFWDKKILVSRDLKIGRFPVKKMVSAVVLIFNSRLALKLQLKH